MIGVNIDAIDITENRGGVFMGDIGSMAPAVAKSFLEGKEVAQTWVSTLRWS